MQEPNERDLQLLAEDSFRLFGNSPEGWPDKVEINRSGYTDVNIRGTWTFEDRTEFYHAALEGVDPAPTDSGPINPDFAGSPE